MVVVDNVGEIVVVDKVLVVGEMVVVDNVEVESVVEIVGEIVVVVGEIKFVVERVLVVGAVSVVVFSVDVDSVEVDRVDVERVLIGSVTFKVVEVEVVSGATVVVVVATGASVGDSVVVTLGSRVFTGASAPSAVSASRRAAVVGRNKPPVVLTLRRPTPSIAAASLGSRASTFNSIL